MTIRASGMIEDPPVCSVCGSNRSVTIHDYPDGKWAYYCEECQRPIPFDEYQEGNP